MQCEANTASCAFKLTVLGKPLLIDANNDNGLDIPELSNTPASEQDTFTDTTKPGKLIPVNDSDKDSDGIPDFADGFNKFTDRSDSQAPPTAAQGGGFVPVTVQLPPAIDPAQVQLSFIYSASDPNQVTRSGSGTADDPYVYTPDSGGSIRLWLKDEPSERNPASVGSNGDWIKPDETFPASKLVAGVIYVEAVTASTALADDAITLTITAPGMPTNSGTVHLTAYDLQFVQINSDGTTKPVAQPQISQPTPTITLSAYDFSNVRFNADNTKILADVHVAGTVSDAASDLIAGDDGKINNLDLLLNGASSSTATIPVSVTKSSGSNSLLHPYAYSGSFDQTLQGIEVQPGWNMVHLTATNAYGFSGYAEASIEVNVDPVNTDIDLSADPYTDSATEITVTFTKDGAVSTKTVTRQSGNPQVWGNVLGSFIIDTSTANGGADTLHVTDTTRSIDQVINFTRDPATGHMKGTFVPDPEEEITLQNYKVSAGDKTGITASTGGDFNPFMVQLVAPAQGRQLP